jgi:hypothetical protein
MCSDMASTDIAETEEWKNTLSLVADRMREDFHSSHPFKDDGEVSPSILALRDAFYTFPVSADVLLIDAGSKQPAGHYGIVVMGANFAMGPIWTLIAHHTADTSCKEVRFHGTRSLADLDSYLPLLADSFSLDHESYRDSIGNLLFSGCWTWDSEEIVDFVPYDIRKFPTEYGRYLAHNLFMSHAEGLIRRFKKEHDFNALYSLAEDPILPLEEWTKIDPATALFVKMSDGKPLTIEERQKSVCDIQLIPRVPDDIRLTFRRAKDAYILGYFRYDFFTVAVHYASLALEAAVKARWSASLLKKVAITCGSDKVEMHFPSHTKISHLYRRNAWRGRTVLVDGQRFPLTMNALLDWLEHEKIVTKWERKGLGIGLSMRNELSHVEHSTTDIPSPDKLRFVAGLVNKLFHSLP